jgi:hypothetical protein
MKQEKQNLMNQGNERQKQQGQELNERELTQKPNVQEVGLDRDEDSELYTRENEERRLDTERLTERSDRRL